MPRNMRWQGDVLSYSDIDRVIGFVKEDFSIGTTTCYGAYLCEQACQGGVNSRLGVALTKSGAQSMLAENLERRGYSLVTEDCPF
jgi:hypothetical protein